MMMIGAWKVSGLCLVSGRCPEDVRRVSGRYQEGLKKVSCRCLEGVWKVSGGFMEGAWKVSGIGTLTYCLPEGKAPCV